MNLVFLLLTTTASAGADPAPYTPPVATSSVVYPVAEGDGEHAEKPGFFARLRNLFVVHKSAPMQSSGGCSCGSAVGAGRIVAMPAAAAPMPAYATMQTAPVPMKSEMMMMPTGVPDKKVSAPTSTSVEGNAKNPF